MNIFSKEYAIHSVRATAAFVVALCTNEQLQKEASDVLLNLTLEKNKEIYKGPIISPIGFIARQIAKQIADSVEIATVYDLEECTSPANQQALVGAINLTSTTTGMSFADILNITYDDGSLPTINNRILLALSRSTTNSDLAFKQLCSKIHAKVAPLMSAMDSTEQAEEAMTAKSSRYRFGQSGKVHLLNNFSDQEVSPHDNKQPNEI